MRILEEKRRNKKKERKKERNNDDENKVDFKGKLKAKMRKVQK